MSRTMNMNSPVKALALLVLALFFAVPALSQKPVGQPKSTPTPVVFAVLDDGKRIEPIAAIDDGKLVELNVEADTGARTWATGYYKPGSIYRVVFGGGAAGTVNVVKSNIGTECGGSSAATTARTTKTKLSGLVMALATNLKLDERTTSFRRRPTADERAKIESLVRAEFKKQGVTAAPLKSLRYQNLTALDLDGDEKPEFVGSYWIAPTVKERRLLFFIAEGNSEGELSFVHSDHNDVGSEDVMSGDLADVDTGIGHELLLDVLDVDQDGVKEIFTIGKAFEGNNYYVYGRTDGKYMKIHESYSYRCAY